jgi:putative transposase
MYGKVRDEVREIIRTLCRYRKVEIVTGAVCIDHVHLCVNIPPKMSVSGFVGYLKGKSSQMIFEKWANARFKYRSRSFWCRGYYVDTVGKNTKKIAEYIQNQQKEDKEAEQLEMEFEDPFTGKKK